MKHILSLALLSVTLLLSPQAHAAKAIVKKQIDAKGLDCSPAADCVFTMSTNNRHGVVNIYVDYTYAAATSVTATCLVGPDSSTIKFYPAVCTGTGTCTVNTGGVFTLTGTADADWRARLDVGASAHLQCTFSGGGSPTSGDIITVHTEFIPEHGR